MAVIPFEPLYNRSSKGLNSGLLKSDALEGCTIKLPATTFWIIPFTCGQPSDINTRYARPVFRFGSNVPFGPGSGFIAIESLKAQNIFRQAKIGRASCRERLTYRVW